MRGWGVVLAALLLSQAALASEWSSARRPSPGPARAIGSPAAGCVAGAEALPFDGQGFQVVRIARNRYYGHPRLIAFVRSLGRAARDAGLETFYVGDLSQPRGGPADYGHASHQNGLDVDIWYTLAPKPFLPPDRRETIETPSAVTENGLEVVPGVWNRGVARLLEIAARSPGVERIFVNGAIKRHLCRTVAGDRSWLRLIRPWYFHDAHFHVRLNCPPGDETCVPGNPIPQGDGCDSSLDRWLQPDVRALRPPPPGTKRKKPAPRLPDECASLNPSSVPPPQGRKRTGRD